MNDNYYQHRMKLIREEKLEVVLSGTKEVVCEIDGGSSAGNVVKNHIPIEKIFTLE